MLPTLFGLAVYYAVFGGEHSIFAVREARADIVAETAETERLRARLLSLERRAEALENDPALLERLAREEFGMIRDGEILYRFADPGAAEVAGEDAGRDDDAGR